MSKAFLEQPPTRVHRKRVLAEALAKGNANESRWVASYMAEPLAWLERSVLERSASMTAGLIPNRNAEEIHAMAHQIEAAR